MVVASEARREILATADSALLHLPILICSSPCMVHITFPITFQITLMNDDADEPGPEMAQEASQRMTDLLPTTPTTPITLESSAVCVT